MKRICFLITIIICAIGIANAAVRDSNTIKRQNNNTTLPQRNNPTKSRSATRNIRTVYLPKNNSPQETTTTRTVIQRQQTSPAVLPRQTIHDITHTTPQTHRAANLLTTPVSNTFNTDYNTCRLAYFTCMDQFCGTLDDSYRRCICSPKITEILSKERALNQTSEQLQDFKTFNIYSIDKTASEVGSMVNASTGEYAYENANDKSDSAITLNTISTVLSKAQTTSPKNTNNFSSNLKISWDTSDLIGGQNISDLTGEALYNTVNAQCLQMISDNCPNETTTQMVTAAYSMYIENDCSLLFSNLENKQKEANSEIRKTEQELKTIRLDNYNSHNSSSIKDCLAMIRQDITSVNACGTDFIHCLDITGKYLNYQTGEPIYSADFYELDSATSLSDNILTDNTNNMYISKLNEFKIFAQQSLDTCQDLSTEIWDEFLRQAITEIHQHQQERISQVKKECLGVVISCYDEQNNQISNFSDIDEQKLLGMRLELSEQMCQEKLTACSNLYGGGPNGMYDLLTAMHNIVSEQIASTCLATLEKFADTLCSPPEYEVSYTYPFECRAYSPGNEICATLSDYTADTINCSDYNNSIYQKLAQHALETCIRPSKIQQGLTTSVLHDINTVMSDLRTKMLTSLTSECEKHDGRWISKKDQKTYHKKNMKFYANTPANEEWGICIEK